MAYCAPEILRGDAFDEKSDVYSYALVLWALYTCEEPWVEVFPDGDNTDFTRRVLFDKIRPAVPKDMPLRLSNLINRAWDADPNQRPLMSEAVEQLDLFMLDVALGSQNSLERSFWERHFGSRHVVDFEEFMGYISRLIPVRNETEEAVVKYLFTFGSVSASPTVTLERYGRMARWFGPFSGTGSDVVTKRMIGATRNRWFHGFVSMSLAVSLLAEQPKGTFLVRFCNSRERGHFFIIYVEEENDIRFLRILRNLRAGETGPIYSVEGNDKFEGSPSLGSLVTSLQAGEGATAGLPRLTKAAPGWPFAQIFLHIDAPNLRAPVADLV